LEDKRGGDLTCARATGIKKLKADVIGLENVGNEFIDKLEIVAVEVKDARAS
jgi:hypothetical protein